MILDYTRNKHADTIDLEDGSILSRSMVEETFFAATVEIVVKVPDLEIVSLTGEIKRAFNDECQKAIPLIQKMKGIRIGPGIIRSIRSIIGGSDGCPRIADLILECCNMIILRFTADQLREIFSRKEEEKRVLFKEQIKQNPRLVGSCIAFAKGSSLMEGVEI
jgi:hypothetical protein